MSPRRRRALPSLGGAGPRPRGSTRYVLLSVVLASACSVSASPAVEPGPAPTIAVESIQADAAATAASANIRRAERTRDACAAGRRTGPIEASPAVGTVLEPGAYTYRTVGTLWLGDGESRALPRTTVLTVCSPSQGGQWTVRDLGQPGGRGLVVGIRLRAGTELAVPQARLSGVVAGSSPVERQYQSGPRADGPVAVEGLGREEITVMGATIETVVRRISAGLRGRGSDGYVVTQWLLPNDLVVREHGDARLTDGGSSTYVSYEAELLPQSWRGATTGRPHNAS